jgi:SAM-dependent methyltransferase
MANKYLLALLPNHNRVYRDQAPALALAEFHVLSDTLYPGELGEAEIFQAGGMPFLAFQASKEPGVRLRGYLSCLSFCYGFFAQEGELLRPLELPKTNYFLDDILIILKSSGKTNEAFTALLYNVTLWSSDFADDFFSRLRVLDPVCGRGTTLYYALHRGHDADGIEVAKADVQVIEESLTRYLQEHRFKHQIAKSRIGRPQGGTGIKLTVSGARDKELLKRDPFSVTVINEDTAYANNHFAKDSYHAIVADLPNGVHGGTGAGRGLIRPDHLLERALPGWLKVLKKGGTLGLSWNYNSVERERMIQVLSAHQLTPLQLPDFRHRADAAVARDILVAKKP